MYQGKLTALLYTDDFRGDHSCDIVKAIDVTDETTIGELRKYIRHNAVHSSDYIRIITAAEVAV